MKESSVRCPHPKCSALAAFIRRLGSVDYHRCLTCGFYFPNDEMRRRK